MATPEAPTNSTPPILLAMPFRPFFVLVGVYAAVLIFAWIGFLFAGLPLPLGVSPPQWHSHEMLFGMLPAAIAGFLLTAMCNWTGAQPLRGNGLLALVLVWLAGRVVMWLSGVLPLWLVAAVDLAFLPVLAVYAGRVLVKHGNTRNLVLVAMLSLLTLANLLMHLGFAGVWAPGGRVGEVLALDLAAVIMIIVGGRITPAFTANWLRSQGRDPAPVKHTEALDRWAMGSALLMVPADLLLGAPWLGALAALAAGLINGGRLWLWRGWLARSEPLVWILHVAFAWVVLALLLKGATVPLGLSPSVWMHAMGTGGVGTLILGVMTRVSMGHTGRPLALPGGALTIYIAVLLAAVARLAAAVNLVDVQPALLLSALCWVGAFAIFVAIYWPILSTARADGRPG